MSKTIANILKKLVSEETLIGILLVVGDYLVELSSNELDNKVWDKVKKSLEKNRRFHETQKTWYCNTRPALSIRR